MIRKWSRIALILLILSSPVGRSFSAELSPGLHPIHSLLGESLKYDISFLWFTHLAEGLIQLSPGDQPETFLVIMEAKTLGVAAFFTSDRVAKYQTLMEIGPSGLLQPLWHSTHTIRGKEDSRKEKVTRYTFDYASGQVRYQKIKNDRVYTDKWFPMEKDIPMFDILSAFYNLRLGFYGQLALEAVHIPTFHRKGIQDIVVEPLFKISKRDQKFFSPGSVKFRILVDPAVFGTKGRDVLASFDEQMRPREVIIKNVIGLGDVHGKLRDLP